MSVSKKHNFGAGPCILPEPVLHQASEAVRQWDESGLSVLEVSHRSPEFSKVIYETENLVRELLDVPQTYSILFLQGGASMQFAMLPMNFLGKGQKAAYLDTGYFGDKAIKEAKVSGEVMVVATSRHDHYAYIPKEYVIPQDAAYFHFTSNNTIEGTEMFTVPLTTVPLVCDMSSDIFSRVIDVSQFDLIYAGAQKNMGPAGMTLVIAKNSFLDSIDKPVHSILDYRVYRDNGSMYNTPPVFAIYAAMLNLQWLKSKGGVKSIQAENIVKAQMLYDEIDGNPLFYGLAERQDRSLMNITFRMHERAYEPVFLDFASKRGMVGIQGYRTVGGFRVSLYNALPLQSVMALVDCMRTFYKNDK